MEYNQQQQCAHCVVQRTIAVANSKRQLYFPHGKHGMSKLRQLQLEENLLLWFQHEITFEPTTTFPCTVLGIIKSLLLPFQISSLSSNLICFTLCFIVLPEINLLLSCLFSINVFGFGCTRLINRNKIYRWMHFSWMEQLVKSNISLSQSHCVFTQH